MPKSGQTELEAIWSATFPSMPMYMTANDTNLFWISENFNPNSTSILTASAAGGAASELVSLDESVTRVFPYLEDLFIAKRTAYNYVVSSIPSEGGSSSDIISGDGSIVDLYVVDNILFFIAGDERGSSIYSYNLDTKKMDELVPNRSLSQRLYVDASHVYWSEALNASGGVYRVPRSGGNVEVLYTGYPGYDIVGDSSRIYWAAGWEILSTDK